MEVKTVETVTTLCMAYVGKPCVNTTFSVSDWAAWVQAIGSVGAIVFSVMLWQRTAEGEFRRAAAMTAVFVRGLLSSLEALRLTCETQNLPRFSKEAPLISEVLMVGRSVPFDRLPEDAMGHFFELRGIANRAQQRATLDSMAYAGGHWEHAKAEYNTMLADAKLAAEKLGRLIPGWPTDMLDDGVR